jgi:hypothetical protein
MLRVAAKSANAMQHSVSKPTPLRIAAKPANAIQNQNWLLNSCCQQPDAK